MSKFLNETGLKHFWGKVKEFLKKMYVAIGDDISIEYSDLNNSNEVKLSGDSITLKSNNKEKIQATVSGGEGTLQVENVTIDKNGIRTSSNVHISGNALSIDPGHGDSFEVRRIPDTMDVEMTLGNVKVESDGISITKQISSQAISTVQMGTDGFGMSIYNTETDEPSERAYINFSEFVTLEKGNNFLYMAPAGFNIRDIEKNVETQITSEFAESPKFIKTGGTATQVLLANGEVSELNAAGGIPKLNDQGKLDASMVDIDNTLFEVVTALPTTGIKQNRIYLVPSEKKESNNTYIEYIYTGDVDAAYDAAKWEKLGEYTADIDLTPYAKKTETLKSIDQIEYTETQLNLEYSYPDDPDPMSLPIAAATTTQAGVMSAADKRFIDIFSARYPLKISSLTATPSLLEVGASSDINFAWGYENNDLHTPQMLQLTALSGDTVTVRGTSYKETGVAGATTATTKTAKLSVTYDAKTDNPKTVERTVNITYHYPSYIGVVANGATIDEAAVKALTKSVEWGKGKTAALTQANQKIVYAYPASYGDLTSIKDGNGFQGFAGYTKQTVTVNGQAYNVYVQNLPATSSSTYTFA